MAAYILAGIYILR